MRQATKKEDKGVKRGEDIMGITAAMVTTGASAVSEINCVMGNEDFQEANEGIFSALLMCLQTNTEKDSTESSCVENENEENKSEEEKSGIEICVCNSQLSIYAINQPTYEITDKKDISQLYPADSFQKAKSESKATLSITKEIITDAKHSSDESFATEEVSKL